LSKVDREEELFFANYGRRGSLRLAPFSSRGHLIIHGLFSLNSVDPFTRYRLWLKAFTWKNEGEPSDAFEMVTDVQGPSAPAITNLTCRDDTSIYIEWDEPAVVFRSVDFYLVFYRSENDDGWAVEEVVTQNGTLARKALLSNLTANLNHHILVRGATRSLYNESAVYLGDSSEAQKILLQRNCHMVRKVYCPKGKGVSKYMASSSNLALCLATPVGLTPRSRSQVQASTVARSSSASASPAFGRLGSLELSAGVVAGAVCAIFAVCLAILALGLWR